MLHLTNRNQRWFRWLACPLLVAGVVWDSRAGGEGRDAFVVAAARDARRSIRIGVAANCAGRCAAGDGVAHAGDDHAFERPGASAYCSGVLQSFHNTSAGVQKMISEAQFGKQLSAARLAAAARQHGIRLHGSRKMQSPPLSTGGVRTRG